MTKRIFLIVSVLVICAIVGLYFIKPSSKTRTREALNHLLQNDFSAADESLNLLSKKRMIFPLDLYRGFLAAVRGQFHNSDLFLQKALNEAMKNNKEEVLVEILLAKAINAYFGGNDHELLLFLEASSFNSSYQLCS